MKWPWGNASEGLPASRPRVLALGTGFGSFRLVRDLDPRLFEVTAVSPRNHFLFSPLLPSTTVGTVEFRSIMEPVRRACPGIAFYQAEALSLDLEARILQCRGVFEEEQTGSFGLSFDHLVIGVGAVTHTFGVPGVKEHAFFLKETWDARRIRLRIVENFERAAPPNVEAGERARLLHFVVVGGGPTGVEFAAEMNDFLEKDLLKAYPTLAPLVRVTVLEAGPSLLGTFDENLRDYTLKHFRRRGIEVLTSSRVMELKPGAAVLASGRVLPFGLAVWAGGLAPTAFVQGLPFEKDRAGRILVDGHCRVPGQEGIWAVGDCAAHRENPLPATAQVAEQQGRFVAASIARGQRGEKTAPFRYEHRGMLAYIGGDRALADLSGFKGKGFFTYLFWRSAYLTKLVSLRNRLLVLFDWLKTLLFGRDISRF